MRNFQDTFETRKQSFSSAFSICMIVYLSKTEAESKKALLKKSVHTENDQRMETPKVQYSSDSLQESIQVPLSTLKRF